MLGVLQRSTFSLTFCENICFCFNKQMAVSDQLKFDSVWLLVALLQMPKRRTLKEWGVAKEKMKFEIKNTVNS